MLSTTPIDPHHLIRFDDFLPDGPHSAWPRRTERAPLPVGRSLAVGALVIGAYLAGGSLAADASSPTGPVAVPVLKSGGPGGGRAPGPVATPVPGEFRLGPGNAMPPGLVAQR
jgi:hypothetical protein